MIGTNNIAITYVPNGSDISIFLSTLIRIHNNKWCIDQVTEVEIKQPAYDCSKRGHYCLPNRW